MKQTDICARVTCRHQLARHSGTCLICQQFGTPCPAFLPEWFKGKLSPESPIIPEGEAVTGTITFTQTLEDEAVSGTITFTQSPEEEIPQDETVRMGE